MRFERHFGQQLEVETQSDRIDLRMLGQKTVVVTFSTAQTVSGFVEGHPWHHNQVKIASIRMILWFGNMEIAFCKFHIFS